MSYGNDGGVSMAGAHWMKQNAAKAQIEIVELGKGWLSHRQDAVSHEPNWKQMTYTMIESSTIQSQRSTLPLSHVPVPCTARQFKERARRACSCIYGALSLASASNLAAHCITNSLINWVCVTWLSASTRHYHNVLHERKRKRLNLQ